MANFLHLQRLISQLRVIQSGNSEFRKLLSDLINTLPDLAILPEMELLSTPNVEPVIHFVFSELGLEYFLVAGMLVEVSPNGTNPVSLDTMVLHINQFSLFYL